MLPVRPLSRPSSLQGRTNGQLPATILQTVPGRGGSQAVTLESTRAIRAWLALCDAAGRAGFTLKVISSYRPYAKQEALFVARYTRVPIPTKDRKVWNGKTYYKKPGVATTAAPGTSNHGWALAVDLTGLTAPMMSWLLGNAHWFGFSWEIQSENWHIRYFTGDHLPQAVLNFEAGQNPAPIEEEDMPETPCVVALNSTDIFQAGLTTTGKVQFKVGAATGGGSWVVMDGTAGLPNSDFASGLAATLVGGKIVLHGIAPDDKMYQYRQNTAGVWLGAGSWTGPVGHGGIFG